MIISKETVDRSKRVEFNQFTPEATLSYGQDEVSTLELSGYILSEADWNFMNHWFSENETLVITDDFGRQLEVYFTELQMERVRKASHPWYHTVNAKFDVLSILHEI